MCNLSAIEDTFERGVAKMFVQNVLFLWDVKVTLGDCYAKWITVIPQYIHSTVHCTDVVCVPPLP